MGPRKLSQEDKLRLYEVFKDSEEYKQIHRVIAAKDETEEIKNIDLGFEDINCDWSKFL